MNWEQQSKAAEEARRLRDQQRYSGCPCFNYNRLTRLFLCAAVLNFLLLAIGGSQTHSAAAADTAIASPVRYYCSVLSFTFWAYYVLYSLLRLARHRPRLRR